MAPVKKYETGHPRRRVWWHEPEARYMKRIRHRHQLGHGMGMGRNTLIHKGRKPAHR